MSTHRQTLGRWGEAAAAEYLEAHGYAILARNVHTSHDEIDIVAGKGGSSIFVKVMTRSSHFFAFPEDSVTRRKQAHMLSAAESYFDHHPERSESWQFDVIAVEGQPGEKVHIENFENVIS